MGPYDQNVTRKWHENLKSNPLVTKLCTFCVAMADNKCVDRTYTVSPESPIRLTYNYTDDDHCTWTINVATGYQHVSIVTARIPK